MAKLFALENEDLDVAASEMEASNEEGEIAAVQGDMTEDLGEITEGAAGVEEGTDAGEQLEEVQELVEKSVEDGTGLDPVAAEAIRLAIEAISTRVGYNPKSIYSLYSTENFQSSSSRVANTQFALETIGEFLKTLWEKIKSAVKWVIEKVKAFYKKHISGLGRVTKALESVKKELESSELKKKTAKVARIPAPGFIKSAFPAADMVGKDTIKDCITQHVNENTNVNNSGTEITTLGGTLANVITGKDPAAFKTAIADYVNKSSTKSKKNAGLVGGKYIELTFDNESGVFKSENKSVDKTTSEKVEMVVEDINDLKPLVNEAIDMIKTTAKFETSIKTIESAFSTAARNVDKVVLDADKTTKDDATKENMAAIKKSLNSYNGLVSTVSKDIAVLTGLNVKLAFVVVGFAKATIKQYK